MNHDSEAAQWQEIIDTIKDAIFQIDAEGRILRCNRAFAELVKKDRDEIIGAYCYALVHDNASFIEECPCLAAKKSLKRETLEHRACDKWFHCAADPVFDVQGRAVGFVLTMHDITESIQTDVLIERYTEELLALVEASGRVSSRLYNGDIYQTICDVAVEKFNLKMAWFGLTEEGSYNVKPVAWSGQVNDYLDNIKVTWDDSPTGMGPVGSSIKAGTSIIINSTAMNPFFGVWREKALANGYLSVMSVPIKSSEDKIIGALALYSGEEMHFSEKRVHILNVFATNALSALENARLLSELKKRTVDLEKEVIEKNKAAEKLKESENKYRTLVENLPQKIFLKNMESVYLSCNNAYARDLNIRPEEIKGKTDFDFYPGALAEKYRRDDKEVIASGKLREVEEKYVQDGREFIVHTIKSPVKDDIGNDSGVLGIFWDITEQKKLEEQLRHAQKLEGIGQLAGGIAHDFNNVLNAVVGYAGLLQMQMDKADPLQHFAEEIMSAGQRGAALTHQILAFSRKQMLDMKPFDLNEIVRDLSKMLHRLVREDIRIDMTLFDKALVVMADASQIGQVLINLITNARDAISHVGSIRISTEPFVMDEGYIAMHSFGSPGEYALLTVSDTGCGMDNATMARIFEPFFTTKEVGKGTGLGLAVVHGIVKQHKGYLNVYSEPASGTTFKIYLPLTEQAVEENETAVPVQVRGGTETLLIAEDDVSLRNLSSSLLSLYGYTVIQAVDGEDAVTKFSALMDSIKLVILDGIMPKMNGIEAYEEMKKLRPGIKVIFVSGYHEDIFRHDKIQDKNAAFVQKPIKPSDLLGKVRQALDRI